MRNITLASMLVILLASPSLTVAGNLENVSGTANCTSWSADLLISFRAGTFMSGLEYSVVLTDANGAEVDRFVYSEFIEIPTTETAVFTFGGAWTSILDGDYTVTGDFTVYDFFGDGQNLSSGTFTTDVACGSAGGDGDRTAGDPCIYTYRYWADHPDLWPVESLEIAGQLKDKSELMAMLQVYSNHILAITVSRELIATQLNLANGSDPYIQPAVDEAGALLAGLPAGSRNAGESRSQAMQVRAKLAKYNRTGCPEDESSGVTMTLGGEYFETLQDKAAIETMTMGTLKAIYR